jgi:alpha-tubulin suppressor-like RCC1 family protein
MINIINWEYILKNKKIIKRLLKRKEKKPEKKKNKEEEARKTGVDPKKKDQPKPKKDDKSESSKGDKKKSTRKEKHVRPTLAHGINDLKLEGIKKISSGQDHSVILLKDGTVYAWGRNNYGQLGLNSDEEIFKDPQKVTIPNKVSDISCGANHTLFLTVEGHVFACGLPKDDRFPSKDPKVKKPIKIVDGIDGHKIVGLSCGKRHNLLISQLN